MFFVCNQSSRQLHRTHRFERNVWRGEQSEIAVKHQRQDDDFKGALLNLGYEFITDIITH